ncbi:hypothetical protein OH146_01185 [Salinibacterium sp. SYSU T00001]|uniref:reprolysin-like metallopeptidase n=1 Tax=Homoserinimonas sedimenticola TaxID=2986805 RepID=UPI0022365FC8|nr:hypothetical protein [Salinibacterium sedimenticola]MCW4384381.1 hypothetical protein [Salinibacterium sedimenticola]
MTKPLRGGLVVLGGLLASLVMLVPGTFMAPADSAAASIASSSLAAEQDASAALSGEDEPAAEPGDELPIADSALAAEASVELTGEVIVSISEEFPAEHDEHEHAEEELEYSYSVETASGVVVPIEGDIPAAVSSGDIFEGRVAVEAEILEQLTPEAADEVGSAKGSEPLAEASSAAQEVLAAATEAGAELSVVEAQVTVAPVAEAAAAQRHELVLVVNSPDGVAPVSESDSYLRSVANSAAAHWQSSSNGLVAPFDVAATIARTSGGTCAESPFTTWNSVATQLGYSSWNAFRTSVPGTARHLVVFNPSGCSETGVGIVGTGLHYGGAVRMSIGGGVDLTTLAHEIGHNIGLGHSNLQVCSGASCTSHEYWDIYDVMGLGVVGFDTLTPLNTSTASRLGFLPAPATQSLALDSGAGSKSWTVSLAKLESSSGIRHLSVTDPSTGEVFHVELRSGEGSPTPYYAYGATRTLGGTSVTFAPGVRLLRASGNGSAVVSAVASGGARRAAIVAGQSVTSPSGGITVAAVSGSVSTAMSVRVTLTSASVAAADGTMPVYRFWSDAYQGHFYTISATEKAQIQAKYPSNIWKYEAVAYSAFTKQVAGTVPLYRFWSDTMNGHFYTASESEKNHVIAAYDDSVWKYEGVAYYVYPSSSSVAGTRPVYRFWSDTKRHHFYTASESEKKHVIAVYDDSVWKYENPAFAVPTS